MRTAGIWIALALLLGGWAIWADTGLGVDTNKDGETDQWYSSAQGGVFVQVSDRNFDGQADYEVRYDAQNRKVSEKMDFNFDGTMDDFYFYEEGKLVRQEIDSNFDGKVDIWVHLDGVYVLGYERDKDYDGVVDLAKRFDQ
jgi:hypothetical protein